MPDPSTPVESPSSFGKGPRGEAKRWKAEVDLFESQQAPIWTRCDRIRKRYRNENYADVVGRSDDSESGRSFSLLWANQQTLQPVIYAQEPKANVQRRYKDEDPVARVAGMVLERTLDFFIDTPDFEQTTREGRDDYLLVGQGVQWRRYVPHMANIPKRIGLKQSDDYVAEQGVQVGNDTYAGYEAEDGSDLTDDERKGILKDNQGPYIERTEQAIKTEEICREHVNQRDFGWSPGARTWAEASAVWRKVFMTRDELVARFGKEKGEKVSLDFTPKKDGGSEKPDQDFFKKATIYEIWDKATKKAHWLAKSYDGDLLDSRDDPLGVDGFFPCARPLFGTQTTDQVTPVPEYLQYQDQAEEMDRLTQKAYVIMDAIKVRGLYAGNIPEMQRLLQDSVNLDFQPVAESIVTMSGGDLNKMVWIWPLKDLIEALVAILDARERVKQDAYEISGVADILRGATDPNETLGAQELKAQAGGVRVKDRQREMQRWIRDGLRIDADIIMNHFQPETIADIADLSSIPEANYRQIDGKWRDPETMKQAGALPGDQPPQMGHNGGPPMPGQQATGLTASGAGGVAGSGGGTLTAGVPPAPSPMMPGVPQGIPIPPQGPTLGEAAIALLKNKSQRKFRIDIETDSTVQLDQAQDKADRTELVSSLTGFFTAIAPIIESEPVTLPMFREILLFAVRGFKAGASLEGMIESTMDALGNRPPKQPQPDPAMLKAQADAKATEQQGQIEAVKAQREGQQSAQIHQADMVERQQTQQTERIKTQGELAVGQQKAEAAGAQAHADIIKAGIGVQTAQIGLETAKVTATAKAKEARKPKPNGSKP